MNTEKAIKNVRTKMMLVTPKKASAWLKKNSNNRNIRDSAVEKLSEDMQSGRWLITHQGIAFNCDGTLLDGQHRLMAIVRSNTSQWMPVTVGLPAVSVSAIDDHLKRSVADSLKIVHHKETPYMGRAVAAAAYLATPGGHSTKSYKSRQAQADVFLKHEKAILWATNAYPTTMRGLCKASILGVVARAYYSQNRTKLQHFCTVLMDPSAANGKSDQIILKLRDFVMTKSVGGSVGLQEVYLKTERALHSWLNGKELTKITAATEELFPIPGESREQLQIEIDASN